LHTFLFFSFLFFSSIQSLAYDTGIEVSTIPFWFAQSTGKMKRAAIGIAVIGGSAFGAYNLYWYRRDRNALVVPADIHQNQQWKIHELYDQLGHKPQKALDNLKNRNISLLQYSTCPFSSKVMMLCFILLFYFCIFIFAVWGRISHLSLLVSLV
jgi:hypothetical protein